jgi:hypothetical protein
MKHSLRNVFVFSFIGLLPLQICIVPKDSTETNIRVMGSVGQYAYIIRSCDNIPDEKKIVPFNEIGASIDHKSASPIRFGVNSSYILTRKKQKTTTYYDPNYSTPERSLHDDSPRGIFTINPFVNAEKKYFAIGGGFLVASRDLGNVYEQLNDHLFKSLSGYIRIGNPHRFYVDGTVFHSIPIFANNYFRAGVGIRANPNIGLWFGYGGLPYDNGGYIIKTNIRLRHNLYLESVIRCGESEGIDESAIGLGLTYKIIHTQ